MPPRNLSAAFWVPPGGQGGGRSLEIELPTELDRPDVGSSGSSKSTKLQPVDTEDVSQWMGPSSRSYTIDGAMFPRDETTLEQYTTVPRIKARLPDRGTLDLVVDDYDISPQRTKFRIPEPIRDQYPDDKPYRFLKEFSLSCHEYSPAQSNTGNGRGGRGGGGGGGSTSIEDVEEDSRTRGAERAVEQST